MPSRSEMTAAYLRATDDIPEQRLQLSRDRAEANQSYRNSEQELRIQSLSNKNDALQTSSDQRDQSLALRESQITSENAQRSAEQAQQTLRNERTASTAKAAAAVFTGLTGLDRTAPDFKQKVGELMLSNPDVINHPEVMKAVQHDLDTYDAHTAGLSQANIAKTQKQFDEARAGVAANQAVVDGLPEGTAPAAATMAGLAKNKSMLITAGQRLIKADPTTQDDVNAVWKEQHDALEPLASGTDSKYDKSINLFKGALGYAPIVRPVAGAPVVAAAPVTAPLAPVADATPSPDDRISVTSPDGAVGHIPRSQLDDALKAGYKAQQ